jgi:hypothetical protein
LRVKPNKTAYAGGFFVECSFRLAIMKLYLAKEPDMAATDNEYKNCPGCSNREDCDFHTQAIDDFASGNFITPQIRKLCPGNAKARHVMFVTSWYLRGLFDYALHGEPYNYAFHKNGWIPEIDFPVELKKVFDFFRAKHANLKTAEFAALLKEHFALIIAYICMQKGDKFKMPKPEQLNYVRQKVIDSEKAR